LIATTVVSGVGHPWPTPAPPLVEQLQGVVAVIDVEDAVPGRADDQAEQRPGARLLVRRLRDQLLAGRGRLDDVGVPLRNVAPSDK
jgi:hypothetical protein